MSSSISLPSTHTTLLLTLTSELALLLVASGESGTLIDLLVLPLVGGPDLTLYIEDAGILVIKGRRLPETLCLISICLIAISKDFFDNDLPKPELSGDEDFADQVTAWRMFVILFLEESASAYLLPFQPFWSQPCQGLHCPWL